MAKRMSLEDRQNKVPKVANSVVSSFTSKNETNSISNKETENVANIETNNEVKKETKIETKVEYTKKVKIGSTVIEGVYIADEDLKRQSYHLRKDTVDKIEQCKKISKCVKKAELVDLILNDALTKILNMNNNK